MIILDTNFLVYILKYKITHQIEEYKKEMAIPDRVIEELEKLSEKGKVKDREAAKLALLLAKEWKIKIIKAKGKADEAIEKLAIENKAKVATLDKALAQRLKEHKIKLLQIRQKKYVIED